MFTLFILIKFRHVSSPPVPARMSVGLANGLPGGKTLHSEN